MGRHLSDPVELFHSENRYRDVAFSPDGSTIYVITDSFGPAQAFGGGQPPIYGIRIFAYVQV